MIVRVLDTNAYIAILREESTLNEVCYITEDLSTEFEIAEVEHEVLSRQDNIITVKYVNYPGYVGHYCKLLEKLKGKRLGNLLAGRGMGDLSLLALLECGRYDALALRQVLVGQLAKAGPERSSSGGSTSPLPPVRFTIYTPGTALEDQALSKEIKSKYADIATLACYKDIISSSSR